MRTASINIYGLDYVVPVPVARRLETLRKIVAAQSCRKPRLKYERLSFARALRLVSADNIMRVETAYAKALRRRWEDEELDKRNTFFVSAAEKMFPDVQARFAGALAAVRSPWVRNRLPLLARQLRIPDAPSYIRFTTSALDTFMEHGEQAVKYAACFASLVRLHCHTNGVPTSLYREGHPRDCFVVLVRTDEAGADILRYKSGLTHQEIVSECNSWGCRASDFFWWLPCGVNDILPFEGRLNPLRSIPNTPDAVGHLNARNNFIEPA